MVKNSIELSIFYKVIFTERRAWGIPRIKSIVQFAKISAVVFFRLARVGCIRD